MTDLEDKYNAASSALRAKFADLSFVPPLDLGLKLDASGITTEKVVSQYKTYTQKLGELLAKPLQKNHLQHRIAEDSVYFLLLENYFRAISHAFSSDQLVVPLVGEHGLVVAPDTVTELLGSPFSHQDYLLALLRLVDAVLEYTTSCIITISTSSQTDTSKKQYGIGLINLKLIGKLQEGFQMLDLRNDVIRRRYDGLKYSYKKVNGVVYDLAMRNLLVDADVTSD